MDIALGSEITKATKMSPEKAPLPAAHYSARNQAGSDIFVSQYLAFCLIH